MAHLKLKIDTIIRAFFVYSGLFCGHEIPTSIISASSIWLKFRSDADNTGRGFLAQYNYGREEKQIYDSGNGVKSTKYFLWDCLVHNIKKE